MKQTAFTVALVIALAVGLVFVKRRATPVALPPTATAGRRIITPPPASPPAVTPAAPEPAVPQEQPPSLSSVPQKAPPANQAPAKPEPTTDVLAREALSFVGLDAEAEEYWVDAINDPRLSADERQNLIEDLNEDGLPDPKHPTLDDLPLILSRLRLIEELAPSAMDQVNFDAFLEAYKDLVNLAELARGRGEPVN